MAPRLAWSPSPRTTCWKSAKEWLEKESAQWAFLDQVGPVAAPGPSLDAETEPRRLDEELRRLADLRARWDEVFGHLAMLFRAMDGWRRMGFASFDHYCTERLGMCVRAVEQRAALERRLYELPSLRQAMVERRLSYEKARLIARYADERSVESWIERAEQIPCIQLRRELQGHEETQMCARGEFDVWVPRRVAGLLALAFGAARKAAGRWLSPGECLVRIAEHFIEVWKTDAGGAEHAPEEDPRAGQGTLPRALLQPRGGARASHRVPLRRRQRRPVEPRQPVRHAPPARRAHGAAPGVGEGAR